MLTAPRVLRTLDPAERYFWLLGHVANMNLVVVAELERRLDPAAVRGALDALQRRHALLRGRVDVVDGAPAFVEASGEIPLSVMTGRADDAGAIGWMLNRPFDPDPSPLVRCVYVEGEGDGRSLLALVVHHALVDARGGVRALQQMLRWLADGDGGATAGDPGAPSVAVPAALHERFPEELLKPRAVVEILSTIRAERDGQAEPSAFPFHARDAAARVSQSAALVVDPPAAAELVAGARRAGASVTGAVAAAVLQAGAALFGDGEDRTICLATPTDLRVRVTPPIDDDVVLAVGLLCTPYLVSGETAGTLAAEISTQTTREVARGESHLFYRFARAGAFAPSDEGIESFGHAMAATPQNIAVSNAGTIDDAGDPPWVRRMTFVLSPSANQVAFVSVTTYRGELVMHVTTDEAKLPPALAEELVAGIGARLGGTRVR
jgi:hypothetical protein